MKRKPTVAALILFCLFSFIQPGAAAGQTEEPELPRVYVETTYPTSMTGTEKYVTETCDLQCTINEAQPGDTIMLQPGATYTGNFNLPYKANPSNAWIIIRSASTAFNANGALPPGTRVDGNNASHKAQMAKIRAPVITPDGLAREAFLAQARANHYRLVGLDIGGADNVVTLINMMLLGHEETSDSDAPTDIVVDRCYVHGNDTNTSRRGIVLNGIRMAVIDSYVSNFHNAPNVEAGDTQAVMGWNGAGPFKIVNNYLEGADENIVFGGAGPKNIGVVPSDIEIQRNHLFKPVSWRGRFRAKNHFELKTGRRVFFNGNILENCWNGGGQGNSIVFKPSNQDGECPWCVVEHITVTNNIIRHSADGVTILASGTDLDVVPAAAHHIKIENNLFYDIGGQWGDRGRIFEIYGAQKNGVAYNVSHLKINHNTAEGSYKIINAVNTYGGSNHPYFTFTNNIVERRAYGIGVGNPREGADYLAAHFTGYTYLKNVLVNNSEGTEGQISDADLAAIYPSPAPAPNAQTFVASDWNAAGLVNRATGDYRLSASSPYKNLATDGKDIGCDIDALNQAINGNAPQTPVTLQSEDFDAGNNGQTYLDFTAGDLGSTNYRNPQTDVDIEGCPDGSCGYWLSWVHAGEWQKYTFNLSASGLYTIEARVTTQDIGSYVGSGGTFHIEIDGVDKTGPMTLPNTGGAWTSLFKSGVSLTAGQHVMRVVADTGSSVTGWVGKFDHFKLTPPAPPPPPVPISLQAEDFDLGSNGQAYYDATAGDFGGTNYRNPATDMDIEGCPDGSCGYWISWAYPGEWLKYSFNVAASASYTFEARVTTHDIGNYVGSGGTFHVEIDGTDRTGPLTLPNTGGTWVTLSKPNITLSPGQHTMRVVFDSGSPVTGWVGKFDHFKLTP